MKDRGRETEWIETEGEGVIGRVEEREGVERNMEMEEGMEGEGGGEGVRGVRERDRGIEIEG